LVLHQGRRSGIHYETPVMVERTPNGFLFALTYGSEVDWYKNVLAAGSCRLRFRGCSYELGNPSCVNAENGLKFFPFPQKFILKWLKIKDFFEMTIKK
jgi:deazaflavin-dependent oxidoreductase (nitroreductase family)